MAKKFSSQHEWDTNIIQLLRSNNITATRDVSSSLNMVQTQLNTLIKLEPLSNKLLSIPQVFVSNELSDTSMDSLNKVSRFNTIETWNIIICSMTEIIVITLFIYGRYYLYLTYSNVTSYSCIFVIFVFFYSFASISLLFTLLPNQIVGIC